MKRLESIIKIHTLSKDQICSLINKTAVTFIDSILFLTFWCYFWFLFLACRLEVLGKAEYTK